MTHNEDYNRIQQSAASAVLAGISDEDLETMSDEVAALDDIASEFGIDVFDPFDNMNIPEGK